MVHLKNYRFYCTHLNWNKVQFVSTDAELHLQYCFSVDTCACILSQSTATSREKPVSHRHCLITEWWRHYVKPGCSSPTFSRTTVGNPPELLFVCHKVQRHRRKRAFSSMMVLKRASVSSSISHDWSGLL